MKRLIKYCILFAVIFSSLNAIGIALPADSIHVRTIPQGEIDELLTGDEYIYGRDELLEKFERGKSPWERFVEWLGDLFKDKSKEERRINSISPPPTGGMAIFLTVLQIFLLITIVAFVIYLLVKSKKVFFKQDKVSDETDFEIIDEDINQMNFDTLIQNAINKKDFRFAIRLQYLKVLKQLSEDEIIDWKINKTNYDYYLEIADLSLRKHFLKLTDIYERIWYGKFNIDGIKYALMLKHFTDFKA